MPFLFSVSFCFAFAMGERKWSDNRRKCRQVNEELCIGRVNMRGRKCKLTEPRVMQCNVIMTGDWNLCLVSCVNSTYTHIHIFESFYERINCVIFFFFSFYFYKPRQTIEQHKCNDCTCAFARIILFPILILRFSCFFCFVFVRLSDCLDACENRKLLSNAKRKIVVSSLSLNWYQTLDGF